MRETRRQMTLYSFYDHTGLERHFERMAEKGWLLCGSGQYTWHYRRIEPKKLTFCVCYYPRASVFDPLPSVRQEEFYDFCAHTGWTLAASSAQLQVFYNEREDPTPIETDPALEVDAIHRSAKKSVLLPNGLLLAVGLLNVGLFLFLLRRDPIPALANAGSLLSALAGVILLALCSVELCAYFLWRHRALRAAERGEFLPTRSRRWLQRIALAALAVAAAWLLPGMFGDGYGGLAVIGMVGAALMIAAVIGIREGLKKRYVSAGANRAVTILACVALSILLAAAIPRLVVRVLNSSPDPGRSELPLSVAELLGGDFSGCTGRWQGAQSPLLGRYTARQSAGQFPEKVYLDYEVTLVKFPALYGLCRETLLHERDDWGSEGRSDVWYWYAYAPTDPAPWGAEEAYQWLPQDVADNEADNNQFLLFYPDRVVEISLQWDQPPTPEQMAAVGEKLGRGAL